MSQTVTAILLAALVTFALRAGPVLLLSRRELPGPVRDWLGFIPAAIMAAIIAAELTAKPEFTPGGISLSLLAAVAAALAGVVTRSLFVTVLAGILAFLAAQAWLP
ncbi:AzlD domain-containing protein [Ruixingdingia sedimenti]|uniref:AzlD domain-containing protein n=1 Tax=Ruixingdingia sedimenti TaxID=3073604 RepID=A0ABU1F8H0_9RHOB|nr:AzlD domain-containing protein [Xinfangfangia sp. LG-4]MDR5653170.1 AzlD domain-containing protein [Xinfangfangia sp. LG-4]